MGTLPTSNILSASNTNPAPPLYIPPSSTTVDLEYADLATIDLSKASTHEGQIKLAAAVCQAMKAQGFFYVINHGHTPEQTRDIFSIANLTFDGVDPEEKLSYTDKSDEVYDGYKPKKTWLISDGVHDQIEHYNINRNLYKRAHPQALRPYLHTIEDFAKHNHFNILHPILKLLALGMELPEDTLVKQHNFSLPGHTSVRFMKYYPRSVEEESKTKSVWLKGHTDIGSITILWSQPVSGLQILSPDGKWRWVRHVENALIVNAGDALEFLCGGFYPSTRHRVVQPPADQRNIPRLGVFYFSMPDDDVKLFPHGDSPVLQKEGMTLFSNAENVPDMETWRKARTASYGRAALRPGKENGVEEEIINGVVVKHYN
ncbi:hypothetical protein BDZ94DRAFT_161967 [Collybia nuda]|uniref:Fe2OG dioxygenase domain-containing protein n=1 Tax=Collybia nuda TaxID=64659 RepID=A0A9P5XWK7_9AGAR|nr:hypothetical protein BDZ94DRAFT_161967 [Collybia nuda]